LFAILVQTEVDEDANIDVKNCQAVWISAMGSFGRPLADITNKGCLPSSNKFIHFIEAFIFVVGNTLSDCPWFAADFVFPRVARLQGNDLSVCQLIINISEPIERFPFA
jgi:hypothetical protein